MKQIIFRIILVVIVLSTLNQIGRSQNAYWVFLTDKTDQNFDPYSYFDVKAIERRIKNGVELNHISDWPLTPYYIDEISKNTDSIFGNSRWFNALAVIATNEQIEKISHFKFVKEITPIQSQFQLTEVNQTINTLDFKSNFLVQRQLESFNNKAFQENKITGKGVRIAVLDGGFNSANTLSVFQHLRDNKQIIATWDFTKNDEFVYYSIDHGTMVLSNIAGIYDGQPLGLATESEFLLAKTEVRTEPYREEVYWMQAMEWADKNGADIINSSLGYGSDRYFRSDMNGKKSLVTRAANMAASKGILVVNSAGNSGTDKWHIIGAPADADSVLAIGGIDPNTYYHINFSSFGPTADGRMKPNVAAFGNTMAVGKNGLANVDGTSFSSPLVAGFAACALQANPGIKNMELFRLIEKSGSLYPYFDYAHGYGIPQADIVINQPINHTQASFDLSVRNNEIWIDNIVLSTNFSSGQMLFFKVENESGQILYYSVIEVKTNNFKILETNIYKFNGKASTVVVHLSGTTKSIII